MVKYIQKTSLIDYPGKIASILFTGGCNFVCPFCYNLELATNPENFIGLSLQEVTATLKSHSKYIDGVVITGGEPTINPLDDLIDAIKDLGLLVKLDTNGTNPIALSKLITKLDYVAMDIKSGLNQYNSITAVDVDKTSILKSIDIILHDAKDYEFRTTIWQDHPIFSNTEDIIHLIGGAKKYYLQNFYDVNDKFMFKSCKKVDGEKLIDKLKPYFDLVELRGKWNG